MRLVIPKALKLFLPTYLRYGGKGAITTTGSSKCISELINVIFILLKEVCMKNIKCENCEKKNDCKELCPAAKVSQASGVVVPSGAELAAILGGSTK